ncbi:MAG: alcohol dehydrogenase catalytic domain-containing protein [Chloroflexi bacterium]|nr:alcohol dehydrogenase catalytic domain-containing protein [Chloroflexota bacterium]
MSQMDAVVVRDGREFRLERIEKPAPGPNEIVIQVEAAGICAADRKIFSGNHPWQLPDPYVPGHEYVGKIVEMGAQVKLKRDLEEGERITAEILVPCRTCWFCHRGLYQHCDRPGVCVGAWADYLKIPAGAIIHRVPSALAPEQVVLIEPLSCSIHAVQLADIQLGDTVVVAGLGAIGMGALQVARLKTPFTLIGVDIDDGLLEIAGQLGADHVLNPTQVDVPDAVRSLSDGRGCDIYIEVSGSPQSITTGLDALRKAGRMVIFGVYGQEATVDFNIVSEFKELELAGGHLSPNTYALAIKYLAEGLVDWQVMVTHTFPLASYEDAINVKFQAGVTSIKTLLIP